MREAGATAAQELAFTLADGIAYLDAAPSPEASTLTSSPAGFFFAAWSELFEEVAKFRAARGCGPASSASASAREDRAR